MADRETAVFLAKLALRMGDYDEVIKNMKRVAEMGVELSAYERKLFRLAYWEYISKRRDSWDEVARLKLWEEAEGNEDKAALVNGQKHKIETEITNICRQVITIIDECIIPSSKTHASLVFFHTMKGDYYRYWGEIKTGGDRHRDVELGLQAHNLAWDTAQANLALSHPCRLGSALSLALFHQEFLFDVQSAFNVVRQAFSEGAIVRGILNLSNVEEMEESQSLVDSLIRKMVSLLQAE